MPDAEREVEPVRGAEFLDFAGALCGCSTLADLERGYSGGVERLKVAPKYALYLFDRDGSRACRVSSGVSDHFIARYEQEGRDVDPVLAQVLETGRVAHNFSLSISEWQQTTLYRRVSHIHRIHHLIEAPVISDGSLIGTLNFGNSEGEPGLTAREVRIAEALGRLVGRVVERIDSGRRLRRDWTQARFAMELTGTAIVTTDPEAPRPRPNRAARALISGVAGGEDHLFTLVARPSESGPFSRHLEVELTGGGRGVLHAYSRPSGDDGALVTVLQLKGEREQPADHLLIALTPREREVAMLVAEGLSDKEIAERLHLSRHTVSQYVKRCYRKLDVGSRVTLTRLLLGQGPESRAPSDG